MKTSRLEAFSDGVLAIIITIMVLELKGPEEYTWSALLEILPVFVSYMVSFIYVGCYWNHHHHLFQLLERVNGKTLWANLHFLFWLSLIPVATSWVGESHESAIPMAFYGMVLLMSSVAFLWLNRVSIEHNHCPSSGLGLSHVVDYLGKKALLSMTIYVIGIVAAFHYWPISVIAYFIVVFMWLIPSRKIEEKLA
ncbi:hypothetical protein BIT28_01755 [Photobacterium proteolyticum]|uniref:DUF1211 domain-containing membrane protein n=1 Tax=Photobacterium proteolyticum TaxID=1903952 RepID=A0A1Q9GVA0_9GAMM|nr:TMEM175 family protein [Photobacterium proteolyticum]OLQ79088.1 hypothetical protein BIT28_01755 [Photobacterium proteolyticum]